MSLYRAAILSLFLGVLGAGCATSSPAPDTTETVASAQNDTGAPAERDQAEGKLLAPTIPADIVQPGYLWELSCVTDRTLNGKFRVDPQGQLHLPYGVTIATNGLKESQVKDQIVAEYARYLKSPEQLHVTLAQKQLWVDVRGLVSKPGKILVSPDESLDELLSKAGGVVQNANAEFVQVRRKAGTQLISLEDYYASGDVSRVPSWEGDDVVFVQRKSEVPDTLMSSLHPMVQLLGEVKKPGEIPFRKDGDFLYYLTKAGGPSPVADLSKIEIIHTVNGKRVSQLYDWEKSEHVPRLAPDDLVIVHADRQTPLEKHVQTAAGFAAILSAIGILIIAL